jgi:hypothetical protein
MWTNMYIYLFKNCNKGLVEWLRYEYLPRACEVLSSSPSPLITHILQKTCNKLGADDSCLCSSYLRG